MRRRERVLGLVVLLVLLLGGGIVLSNRANHPDVIGLALVAGVVFGAVGAPVAWREPRNAIGWLLLVLPILVAVSSDAAIYSILAYRIDGHGLPLSPIAVALAPSWVWLQIGLPLPILRTRCSGSGPPGQRVAFDRVPRPPRTDMAADPRCAATLRVDV